MEKDLKSLVKNAFQTPQGSIRALDPIKNRIKKIIETGRFTDDEIEKEVINYYTSKFKNSQYPAKKEDAIRYAKDLIGIGIKKAEEISANLKDTSTKLSAKKFKLKEDRITLGKCLEDLSRKYGLIKESFVFGVDTWASWLNVYLIKAPADKEDIEKAAKGSGEIRFIAVAGSKDLYVFNSELSHEDADSKLGIKPYRTQKPVIAGTAELRNRVWKVANSWNVFHGMEVAKFTKHIKNAEYNLFMENILKADWSWMEPYIKISDFLKGVELQWKMISGIA